MASNTDASGSIYKWIERKPLTEAVAWSSREKFWLITATCHYGIHDWKSIAQVVRNSGEPYRPKEWFTTKSCERQFKIIVSNYNKEIKLPLHEMLPHIAEGLRLDYIRDANKSKDNLKAKYSNLFNILNRVKQGNLSRQEVVNLYSLARRNEIESKQYVDQLMKRQSASLALENSNSSLSDEPIKWNTPSAPLLTSLLRSRNTIPANRTVTTITSLLPSPCGSPRTRSGKLLPLSTSKIQGTPTLSKLLEAPANPYIPSPALSIQKIKPIDIVGTDKVLVIGSTSRNENLQSSTLNKLQINNITSGSVNQINKSDLSILKRQMPKSTVSAVNNVSTEDLNVVDLLSDSENEEDTTNSIQNIQPINLFGEKKDTVITTTNSFNTIYRIEPRTTRSQTRAEGGFKPFNDSKLSDMNKEQENLQQLNERSQMTNTNSIEDELIDIDQIEIEPLSSVHDEIITPNKEIITPNKEFITPNKTPNKMARSCIQISQLNNSIDSILSSNLLNCKEINNQMLEEISAGFIINPSTKNVATEYKNIMVGQSRIGNGNIPGCLIPIDVSAVKDTILLRKEGQPFLNSGNTLTTFNDRKLLNKKKIIELKGTNIRCVDSRNDTKVVSINNKPVVVVNQIKKPFNIRLTSDQKDNTDTLQASNIIKKPTQLQNSSQNVVHLFDGGHRSLSDEVIIIDDDVNVINDDERALNKIRELSVQDGCKNLSLTVIQPNNSSNSGASKSGLHFDDKGPKNNIPWKMFGKTQNILDLSSKNPTNQDGASVSRIGNNSNINQTSNRFIKEIDFDFDHSISQTSLSELYNGVEEIVEMHSFDNEELNSLIECGSLDNNETEEPENIIINIDQGDSSISESDSTIGAFDSFAQITGVSQNSSCSTNIIPLSRKSKSVIEENNFNRVGFVQSVEIGDDQISVVPVTSIPILQGVISDVMNTIDTDQVPTHINAGSQNISVDEIVEISSDEEEIVSDTIQYSSNISERNKIEAYNKGNNTYTSKEGLKNLHELDSTFIIEIEDSLETDDLVTKNSENNIQEVNNFVIVRNSSVVNANKGHFETINIHSNREREIKENEIALIRSNDNKLMNADIIKETNKLVEARAEKTDLKFLSGPLKMPQINTEVIKSVIVSEEQMFKKCEEKQEKDDQEKKTNNKNENEFKSAIFIRSNESVIKRVKDFTTINSEFETGIIQRPYKQNEIINLVEENKFESRRVREAEIKRDEEEKAQKAREAEIKRTREIEVQRAKEAEIQRAKEIEILRAKEAEIQRAKEIEVQRAKEAEIQRAREIEEQRAKEAEIQRAKEIEVQRAKEAEIQRAKEIEVQRAKEAEIQRAREIEEQRAKEAEIQRAKEIEVQRAKEAEIQRAKEIEVQRAKEAEIQRAKEIEVQRAKEAEIQRAKEIEVQRAKEAEIQRAKEIEVQRAKEAEIQRAREIEEQRAKDLEIIKYRHAEIMRKKESEIRKRLEAELQEIEEESRKLKEAVIRRKEEEETRRNKEIELKRIKDAEIKKEKAKTRSKYLLDKRIKENDARMKEVEFMKHHMELKTNSHLVRKDKEDKIRKQIDDVEKILLKERKVLASEDLFQIENKQPARRMSIETRKNSIKELENDLMKKELQLKRAVEQSIKQANAETMMMTRRRKSKAEDKSNLVVKPGSVECTCDKSKKFNELNTCIKSSTIDNSKKVNELNTCIKSSTIDNSKKVNELNTCIKSSTIDNSKNAHELNTCIKKSSTIDNSKNAQELNTCIKKSNTIDNSKNAHELNTCIKSSTIDNSSTSNNDNKKPTRNVKNEQKRINLVSNSTAAISKKVSAKKQSCKKITKKDSTSHEISGKSRTRSSMPSKLSKTVESKSTSSDKSNNQSEAGSTLKHNTTPKRIITNDIPIASGYNCQNSIELIKREASRVAPSYLNAELLTIPVVVVNTNDVKEYNDRLAEKHALLNAIKMKNDCSKNLKPKVANNEEKLQKEIDDNKKSAPKTRGRKRKRQISSTANEKIQPPKKKANKAVKNVPLPKVKLDPPAKRTRSTTSKKTKKTKITKITKKTKKTKKIKTCDEEFKKIKKEIIKGILKNLFNKVCANNKYLSGIERHAKNLSPEDLLVIKQPIILRDIKRKILQGQIKTASELQKYLLIMSFNTVFLNTTNTVVFNDVTAFQRNLYANSELSHYLLKNGFNEEDKNIPILEKPKTEIIDDTDNDYNNDFYNSYYNKLAGVTKSNKAKRKISCTLETSDLEPDGSEPPDSDNDFKPLKKGRRRK